MVIQARPLQLLVVQRKSKGFDQMQSRARVGAEANDVARIGRNFRLKQYNIEHLLERAAKKS